MLKRLLQRQIETQLTGALSGCTVAEGREVKFVVEGDELVTK